MLQPLDFIDVTKPTHVCRIQKALYGLKKALWAWHNELKEFLISFGFINC